MNDNQYILVVKAFRKACKYLRDHPPIDACDDAEVIVKCVLNGVNDDPEGARWMRYFLEKATEEEVNEC